MAADPSGGSSSSDKVVVLFKAVGDAPILRHDRVKITGAERFAKVVDFLRKQLQLRDSVVRLRCAVCAVLSAFDNSGSPSLCTCAPPLHRVSTTR
jgi:hypothetical protein